MAKPKKAAARGWIPKPKTRRVEPEGEYWTPDDGSESLWAEVTDNLTFAQCDAIPFGPNVQYRALWDAIAPHVLAWNVLGIDTETGDYAELPAPANAGPDVFQQAPKAVAAWLGRELKYGPFQQTPDQKKESATSDATESG